METTYQSFLGLIDPVLHCCLLNWMVQMDHPHTELEKNVALALQNILSHGNSQFRPLASQALACLKGLDRHITGDTPPLKVIWGETSKLDDCTSQRVSIGSLSFFAIDFGDTLSLSDQLQRSLNSPDKTERNQCTLIALAAGITARSPGQTRNIPSALRVKHLASELRGVEWAQSSKGSFTETNPHSFNEKVIANLCHDIRNINHDRDYRSLCIFLGEYLDSQQITLRVFDIRRSGTGDTSLQANVIGNLEVGAVHGFTDLLAAGGTYAMVKTRWGNSSCGNSGLV